MMSSVDSTLTSAATLISRDFCRAFFRSTPGDRALLTLGRTVTLVLLVFGVLSAPLMGSDRFGGIYEAIQHTLAIIQGPTWALLLVGMFWARATAAAGVVSLFVGLGTSIGLTVWQRAADAGSRPFTAEDPFMFIAAISFAATVVCIGIVSTFTTPKTGDDLRGLVYRASFRDADVQDTLRRRAGEGEEDE